MRPSLPPALRGLPVQQGRHGHHRSPEADEQQPDHLQPHGARGGTSGPLAQFRELLGVLRSQLSNVCLGLLVPAVGDVAQMLDGSSPWAWCFCVGA